MIKPRTDDELLRQGRRAPEILSQDREIRAGERAERAVRESAWPRIDLRASANPVRLEQSVGFPKLIGHFPSNFSEW